MPLMIWGTSSNAGKTSICSIICRVLHRNGVDVVPFKASNLSSNTYITDSGREMGVGQVLQAWACDKEPSHLMNPVLLRPVPGGGVVYVLNGLESDCTEVEHSKLMDVALGAYDHIVDAHGTILCEGSGSPSELNLQDRDIANIGVVRHRRMNVLIVGDIERGGVFAAIYGTWLLTPEDIRSNVRGFIINRFRGDPSILSSGIEALEGLTGMRCAGVLPYIRGLDLPEEDSATDRVLSEWSKDGFLSSLDRMSDVAEGCLDMEFIRSLV